MTPQWSRYYCFIRDGNIPIVCPKPHSWYMVESRIKYRSAWKLQWNWKSAGVEVKTPLLHIAVATFVNRRWFAMFNGVAQGMRQCCTNGRMYFWFPLQFPSHTLSQPIKNTGSSGKLWQQRRAEAQITERASALHCPKRKTNTPRMAYSGETLSLAAGPIWILFHFLITWVKTNPRSLVRRTWSLSSATDLRYIHKVLINV